MRPHTSEQVAGMKSFVDSQPTGAERKTYALNGLEVTYTTVDMGDTKAFDYAVAAFVAPRDDGEPVTEADYEIAVSSDVPEELQGMWAWHELHDFGVLGHEAESRCLQTEEELATAMAADSSTYQEYLSIRMPFYKGLAAFTVKDLGQKGNDSVYSPSDLKGCYDAIKFLETQEYSLKEVVLQTDYLKPEEKPAQEHIGLLALVKARKAELDTKATQKTAEVQQKEESRANYYKGLERQSNKRAAEFIKLMQDLDIPTVPLFRHSTVVKTIKQESEKHKEYDYEKIHSLDKIGEGWIVDGSQFFYANVKIFDKSSRNGLILLTDIRSFRCIKPDIIEPGIKKTWVYDSNNRVQPDIVKTMHVKRYGEIPEGSVVIYEGGEKLPYDAPFSDIHMAAREKDREGNILVETALRLGAGRAIAKKLL